MVDIAANFSGSIPEYYDRIMGPAQLERYAADLARRLPVRPPGDVLELACGTGIVTARLRARLDPGLRLVASDLSKPMLDYARNKLRGLAGVEWREADASALPFKDAAFGEVVCGFGVMFVPDKQAVFREARRVLREGGGILFNVWDGLEANPNGRAAAEAMEALFPGDPEMKFSMPYSFNDRDVLRAMLSEARFREPRMESVALEASCPSAREYATGQLRGTPRGLLIEKRGIRLEDAIDKVAAALARVGGDAPFKVTTRALVVEARAI